MAKSRIFQLFLGFLNLACACGTAFLFFKHIGFSGLIYFEDYLFLIIFALCVANCIYLFLQAPSVPRHYAATGVLTGNRVLAEYGKYFLVAGVVVLGFFAMRNELQSLSYAAYSLNDIAARLSELTNITAELSQIAGEIRGK